MAVGASPTPPTKDMTATTQTNTHWVVVETETDAAANAERHAFNLSPVGHDDGLQRVDNFYDVLEARKAKIKQREEVVEPVISGEIGF